MTLAHPQTEKAPGQGHDSGRTAVRVGTRGSPLALVQTRAFMQQIADFAAAHGPAGLSFEEHQIRTTGDRVQDVRLAEIGGKGLFAKEIHEAMLDGRIDLAVHSLKDLETTMPDGIVLGATLTREDCRDALILGPEAGAPNPADPFACLPQGGIIGTSSVRRQSQLLHRRPDLKIALLRGNVQTRLERTERGDFGASLLALAGLRRLGLQDRASLALDPEAMLPAACQGIVGVTVRAADADLVALLAALEDKVSRVVATAERSMLAFLDGSCRTPIGGHARLLPDGRLHLSGLVAREDGSFLLKRSVSGAPEDGDRMGRELGTELRRDSPEALFA
jgi:hydroxymethylbilane synthase